MIEIRIDDREIKQLQRTLAGIPRALPTVMSRGLNRTAEHTRTLLSRLIHAKMGLGVRYSRKQIYMKRASRALWKAEVSVSNFRASLINLNPEQTKTGVTYSIGGKRLLLRHAFIAVGAKRGRQVWLRSLHAIGFRKYIEWRDRTMEALYVQKTAAISDKLIQMAGTELNQIYSESLSLLEKNIQDQVNLILARRAG